MNGIQKGVTHVRKLWMWKTEWVWVVRLWVPARSMRNLPPPRAAAPPNTPSNPWHANPTTWPDTSSPHAPRQHPPPPDPVPCKPYSLLMWHVCGDVACVLMWHVMTWHVWWRCTCGDVACVVTHRPVVPPRDDEVLILGVWVYSHNFGPLFVCSLTASATATVDVYPGGRRWG